MGLERHLPEFVIRSGHVQNWLLILFVIVTVSKNLLRGGLLFANEGS